MCLLSNHFWDLQDSQGNLSRIIIKKIAQPLYLLLRKDQERKWEQQQEEFFAILKQALMRVPVLAYPQPNRPFFPQLATTKESLSAVLLQDMGTGMKLVAFGSRLLRGIEQQFNICEKEVLARVRLGTLGVHNRYCPGSPKNNPHPNAICPV